VAEQTQRTGADRNVMRDLNRSLVLDILREQSPISRAAIAKTAQLTKPTISAIVDDLIADGLVTEIGMGATTTAGGRPPILLEFNERSQFLVGVHIGVRRTTIVIADARGAELGRVVELTPKGKPAAQLARIGKRVLEAVDEHGADRKRLAAVGVVVPGLTDFVSGVCLLAPNLGWRDVPVGATFTELFGVPVFVQHSGQGAVVAEHIEGAAQGYENVAMLYTGSGLGAGVIAGGRVFHGARGFAAEIGHCKVPGNTEACTCGGIGCIETVASARAIVRLAGEALTSAGRRRSGLSKDDLTPETVAAAAADGDAVAADVIAAVGRNLGLAAAWLTNVFNPDVVVLGGGLIDIGAPLLEPLRQAALEAMLPVVRTEIRVSALGQDAEVRGAVLLALQQSQTFYRLLFQG
jgi:predicted NBD/HSP70 family sugar kinase